jgi:hypothetical protein
MSTVTMILGESGSGKSTALRNLNAVNTLLIQTVKKPLPFKATNWKPATKENPQGAIFVCDNSATICEVMRRTTKPIIVVDDFQYLLANEFMRRSDERGYDKFTEIARHAWDVLMAAGTLADHKRVYILCHTNTDESGRVRAKTIGKMLDEKITIEGLVTIVLRTAVINGQYLFRTQNNGSDTTKSPMGLFDAETIPNDLAEVDQGIVNFYGLTLPNAA